MFTQTAFKNALIGVKETRKKMEEGDAKTM